MQIGAGLGDVMPDLWHLLAMAVYGFLLTRIRMKMLVRNLTGGPVPSPVFTAAQWIRGMRKKIR